ASSPPSEMCLLALTPGAPPAEHSLEPDNDGRSHCRIQHRRKRRGREALRCRPKADGPAPGALTGRLRAFPRINQCRTSPCWRLPGEYAPSFHLSRIPNPGQTERKYVTAFLKEWGR